MDNAKDIGYGLYELERLFHNSATYGLSLFQTLSLPEDDENANAELLKNFKNTLENQFEDKNIVEHHVENIKYIRQQVLTDPNAREQLEQKIEDIRERIAMELVVHEDNLGVDGDFDPFDPEK